MSIRILHQCGHNPNWNLESFTNDSCGDGLILSPVHQTISKIELLDSELKIKSIFDPQYYLPNSQKTKLKTFPFFPDTISKGFSTKDFTTMALESARQCVRFQIDQDFAKIIIPTRFLDQMDPDFTSKQETFTVRPFLEILSDIGIDKPVYLTLPITSHMIENKTFRTMLLNWVTSFPEINGIYVIAAYERDSKQIQSDVFLKGYLDFLTDLKNADLGLIIGYTNTESLIYTLLADCTITVGSFENTRIFSIDKFIVRDEERRGPKARIYLPGLLNWIDFSQAKEIRKRTPKLWSKIYRSTDYGESALAASVEPTFNQPALYKHHFICFFEQVEELRSLKIIERYKTLSDWIENAKLIYRKIGQILNLEKYSNGDHLQAWSNSLKYYESKLLIK